MMDRCIACESAFRVVLFDSDPWCWSCVVGGGYAAYVEAHALSEAIDAERQRRTRDVPHPRADPRSQLQCHESPSG